MCWYLAGELLQGHTNVFQHGMFKVLGSCRSQLVSGDGFWNKVINDSVVKDVSEVLS